MGPAIIARNYAETLLTLARNHGGESTIVEYGAALDDVADILSRESLVREFLETPRVELDAKKRAIEASFGGRVPDLFLRFLLVVVEKRRQALLREIAQQYRELVDEVHGRARAEIILAREPDDDLRRDIVATLERRLGKTVVPIFRIDSELMGGVIIRVGGEVLDGSLRRRVAGMRRQLLGAPLPAVTAGGDL